MVAIMSVLLVLTLMTTISLGAFVTVWAEGEDKTTEQTLREVKDEFDRLTAQDATFIFVTNEIGSGGVSTDAVQRQFTDLQGWMNQYVARRADEVLLMVSGIAVKIK